MFPESLYSLNPIDVVGPRIEPFEALVTGSSAATSVLQSIDFNQNGRTLILTGAVFTGTGGGAQLCLRGALNLVRGSTTIQIAGQTYAVAAGVATFVWDWSGYHIVRGPATLQFGGTFSAAGVANTVTGSLFGFTIPTGDIGRG